MGAEIKAGAFFLSIILILIFGGAVLVLTIMELIAKWGLFLASCMIVLAAIVVILIIIYGPW